MLTGGTDVHLVLVDLGPTGLDGKTAESRLEEVGITVNRNAIPFDERPPMNPSGLRIGTPALTTRGLVEDDMREIAQVICVALSDGFEAERDALLERTRALMERYPLYPQLRDAADGSRRGRPTARDRPRRRRGSDPLGEHGASPGGWPVPTTLAAPCSSTSTWSACSSARARRRCAS